MKDIEFNKFPKMPRWSREIVITEKIDGTNASIYIGEDGEFLAGNRTRWITPEDDNFGFAGWAYRHKDELMELGVGHHFGEWWGQGIQRKYALDEKRFSLFNTSRWFGQDRPECCGVVPILYQGMMLPGVVEETLSALQQSGSAAAAGFMKPEGIVIYHIAGRFGFKKTIEKDEIHKSQINKAP